MKPDLHDFMENHMDRQITVSRKTNETDIVLTLNLDGSGSTDISTGISFFDHMLTAFCVHGFFDLSIKAEGDLDVDEPVDLDLLSQELEEKINLEGLPEEVGERARKELKRLEVLSPESPESRRKMIPAKATNRATTFRTVRGSSGSRKLANTAVDRGMSAARMPTNPADAWS